MNKEKPEKTEDKENIKRKDNLIEKLKQFTKTRWFPLIVAVTLVALAVGVVLIMLLFGWRVTYAPELENDWDAISGVAAWVGILVSVVSVGASFAAVWVAIQIPNKIAKQQEKIALYTQRLEFYNVLDACIRFSNDAENQSSHQIIEYMFAIKVGFGELPEDKTDIEILKRAMPLFHRVITSLRAGEFLFDFEVQEYVQKIIDTLPDLLNAKDSETIQECFLKYQEAVNETQENLIPLIKDTLRLWNNK